MDDTTLISHNRDNMQIMLDTCNEFYTINDINVNPIKSNFIVINNSRNTNTQSITIGNDIIIPLPPNISARILGVWHNGKDNKQYQKELIIQKVEIFRKTIGKK